LWLGREVTEVMDAVRMGVDDRDEDMEDVSSGNVLLV
jgi:hypothetical protein